ncbi:MAG: aldo/keto reductase [Erysipelotrichaceae bacterium]|nr:aldo/keto reductase [Erysipelotrichaceae bacterium]
MIINDLNTIPHFGFGLMRLPLKDPKDPKSIDMEQLKKMVDAYMEKGFTYFDTAYPYHKGLSEVAIREALVKRYDRESFLLADKLPAWSLNCEEDRDRIFNEQLERTGAGFFDFYLMHSVETKWLGVYEKFDCFNWALKKKEEGLIRHFGISYHDSPELLEEILKKYPEIEFVQIQMNYLDWKNPIVQSEKNYEICRKYGKYVNVMEPVKGGTLANLPKEEAELLKAKDPEASQASWAIRFALSHEGMMVVLSGMSSFEQMEDNLNTTKDFKPLNEEEFKLLEQVAESFRNKPTIGCTGCRYCVDGCPMQITIPDLFKVMNKAIVNGCDERTRGDYKGATVKVNKGIASDCIKCGQCEEACPQHLPIRSLLEKVAETFD